MLTLFGRKKLTEEQVARIFVNGIQSLIDEGFMTVAALVNDSPEFVSRPSIGEADSGAFTLIVLAGNLQIIPAYFDAGRDKRIAEHILSKFADLYEIEKMKLAHMVGDTRKFMNRKNHPGKNVETGMAKALFARWELNPYQEEYFRSLAAPNPIIIQRLRDALKTFLWNWETIHDNYRIVQTG